MTVLEYSWGNWVIWGDGEMGQNMWGGGGEGCTYMWKSGKNIRHRYAMLKKNV